MKNYVLAFLVCALPAWSYEYKVSEWLLRPVLGKAVYFVQDPTTTAGGGLLDNILTGLELEYMLTRKFSVGGAFRPLFAANSVALGFGVAAKYRFVQKDIPLIPFLAFGVVPSGWIPTDAFNKAHFNLGFRPSAGLEYFVARDLALGIEAAMTPSFIFGKGTTNVMEASFEVLAGASWRL